MGVKNVHVTRRARLPHEPKSSLSGMNGRRPCWQQRSACNDSAVAADSCCTHSREHVPCWQQRPASDDSAVADSCATLLTVHALPRRPLHRAQARPEAIAPDHGGGWESRLELAFSEPHPKQRVVPELVVLSPRRAQSARRGRYALPVDPSCPFLVHTF